jgi:hypothetical protein
MLGCYGKWHDSPKEEDMHVMKFISLAAILAVEKRMGGYASRGTQSIIETGLGRQAVHKRHAAAERLGAQELPALTSVVTERHLTLPAFLVARC